MKTALVIMAAGLGTRYGGGVKQLTPVGGSGEIIMDYSIHDAIEAGFNEIVFVIRRDIEADFREAIGDRIAAECEKLGVETHCAFQEIDELPEGFKAPEGRTKPWGTVQAVLVAREFISGPFCVINADDYYGKTAFREAYEFLKSGEERETQELCVSGYILGNTLSESGGVTRGICYVDENGFLTDIHETRHIIPTADGAEADGVSLDPNLLVSMNLWGIPESFMDVLYEGFTDFLVRGEPDDLKREFLLPVYINELLREDRIRVKVLPTGDHWFGMTYREDTPGVIEAFRQFSNSGYYKTPLFSDLEPSDK